MGLLIERFDSRLFPVRHHMGQRVYRWLRLHSSSTTTMKISRCLLCSTKEGPFWHWIISFSWSWDVWCQCQTNVSRTVNVKMVTAKRACVFAIVVGGVVSVSFVDSGERENRIFRSSSWTQLLYISCLLLEIARYQTLVSLLILRLLSLIQSDSIVY